MYCKKCGNQLSEGAKFCDGCGAPVETATQQTQQTNMYAQQNYQPQYQQPMYVQREQNIMAILGLIFAFICSPVGLGLSIADIKRRRFSAEKVKELRLPAL